MPEKKIDSDRLKSLLECSICLDQFNDPKMLACTHEFCKQCIEDISQFQTDGSLLITCPMRCKPKTMLRDNQTVSDLTASYNFRNLLDALTEDYKNDTDADVPRCSHVKKCKGQPISVFCCGNVMCSSCHVNHVKDKSREQHIKTNLCFSRKQGKLGVLCDVHASLCTSVCIDNQLMCVYCEHRHPQHKRHEKFPIEENINLIKETLQAEMRVRERLEEFKAFTQKKMELEKLRFRSVLEERRKECLRQYKEILEHEEERLVRKFEGLCQTHLNDVYVDDMSPGYCEKMLLKHDVELLLQREDIYDEVVQSIRNAELSLETISFDPTSDILNQNPLGVIRSIDGGRYDTKEVIKSTIYCDFAAGGEKTTNDMTATTSLLNNRNAKVSDLSTSNQAPELQADRSCPLTTKGVALALKSRGNNYFKKRDYPKAINCYTKAIQFCPNENSYDLSVFYHNRAAALEEMKEWRMVIKDCSEALKLNPRYVKALQRRARAYFEQCRSLNTIAFLKDAFEDAIAGKLLDNYANRTKDNGSFVSKLTDAVGKQMAEAFIEEHGYKLPAPHVVKPILDNFNYDLFDIKVESASMEGSKYSQIVVNLKQELYDNIEALCTEVINLDGKHRCRAMLLRGTIKFVKNDVHNAIKDIDEVLGSIGESSEDKILIVDAMIKRACLKLALEDKAGMVADLARAVQIDNKNASLYHHWGMLSAQIGDMEQAVTYYRQAISLDKQFVAPRLSLGECLYGIAKSSNSMSLMQEADLIFQEANKLFPTCCEGWRRYGEVLYKHSKTDEALNMFEKAIEVGPDQPLAYSDKGRLLLFRKRDLPGATQCCRAAVERDERCYSALYLLGSIYMIRGQYDEAIVLFERSIQSSPRSADIMKDAFGSLADCRTRIKIIKQHQLVRRPVQRNDI